jgi:hypothetical protein
MTHKDIHKTISCYIAVLLGLLISPGPLCGEEARDKADKLESGFYYTIKKGDTLWDLSQRFFDSPWVWPDLWEKNKEIPNPHWIYPGNTLRILTREGLEAFRKAQAAPEAGKEAPARYYLYPAIDSVGFLRQEPIVPWGSIFKVQVFKEMISEGDMVYIRPDPGKCYKPGERYAVFRVLKTFRDDKTKTVIGTQHCIVGLVDIVRTDKEAVTGTIWKSYRHIEIGDHLMPYEARSPRIRITDSVAALEGTIVAPEEGQELLGDHAIVFVDKGRQDGVDVGQYYTTYNLDGSLFGSIARQEEEMSLPVDTGEVLILHTEDTTATALITSARDTIQPGVKFRAPSAH